MPLTMCTSSLMSSPVSVCRARSVRCSHRSPSSNSPVQTRLAASVISAGAIIHSAVGAPAVLLGEHYRLPAAPLGSGERADLGCEPELRQASAFEVGAADLPGQDGSLQEVAFGVGKPQGRLD